MKVILSKAKAKQLLDFCKKYKLENFFFAKDQGAYFGQNTGTHGNEDFKNIIFYVKGCNPDIDEEWYENARNKFGGDDFGEHFEISVLESLLNSDEWSKLIFVFKRDSIEISLSA